MKKILGLDLGTTSIGWALVNEAENNDNEQSSIIKLGVRVIPLTVDEKTSFEKGKAITTNAQRRTSRGARRNLQRYKLRRNSLIAILKEHHLISNDSILAENGNASTFETYRLRAKSATEEVSLEEFARVLLMINKKRGYKSNRKLKDNNDESGSLIDSMDVAKRLYDEQLTPGQLCDILLKEGKQNVLPDFYRSDLQLELNKVWKSQKQFYPELLTDDVKKEIIGKNKTATWAILKKHFVWKEEEKQIAEDGISMISIEVEKQLVGIKRVGKVKEQKAENYSWRANALTEKLGVEQLAIVISEINGNINSSSGYLGSISDRSKELYFDKLTVGQYLMRCIQNNPNDRIKGKVFYRQDYLDEFNKIWDIQSKYHGDVLTASLKEEIRDVIIFYQRKLKSQKALLGYCEFENEKITKEINNKQRVITVGSRVIPKFSPLFQEFKIWQRLNDTTITEEAENDEKPTKRTLTIDEKLLLADLLAVNATINKKTAMKALAKNSKKAIVDLNFEEFVGNETNSKLFGAINTIIEMTGHNALPIKSGLSKTLEEATAIFNAFNWNSNILSFDASMSDYFKQDYYKLCHLLYSFQGDNSRTGDEKLVNKIIKLFNFDKNSPDSKSYAKTISNITFGNDYGSLSAKAIFKILPYLKEGFQYDEACAKAGYKHSKSSLTKEEIDKKELKEHLDILSKGSLRNPVVEKILNQMVNVINNIIDTYGRPDEIRVEMARELKKNARERNEMWSSIESSKRENAEIAEKLKKEFNIQYITKNDIIRYKLYEELSKNEYKTLYSNQQIKKKQLFTSDVEIEHIIPRARLSDDSISNKTLEFKAINSEKANRTAYDYMKSRGDKELEDYVKRCKKVFSGNDKKAKLRKLLMSEADIPSDFVARDLKNTQYIAKKAMEMLNEICRRVVATSGSITDELREDWQLVDIMKEINLPKYKALDMVEYMKDKNGNNIVRISDWSKRDDHRHHAMDALTVAFTKDAFIQYFNNKNASVNVNGNEISIRQKYFENGKAKAPIPLNEFRAEAKRHLNEILVSFKAKNKVITPNTVKGRNGNKTYLTPRGQLHNETIYGSSKKYETKEESIGSSFNEQKILSICNSAYQDALLKRLHEFGNDPKKAFTGKNSPEKNPIWINEEKTHCVPSRVKTVELKQFYTVRKNITPDLKIDKVVDKGIKAILQRRLEEFDNDPKKAFANLEQNPIWLNKEKGIQIKTVTVTGVEIAVPLHSKKDNTGKLMHDENGHEIPNDFVSPNNNHHIAIYRRQFTNKQGNQEYEYCEKAVSFLEAVARVNAGLTVIDKDFKKDEGWEFLFSMKRNEYFLFPNEATGFNPNAMSEEEIKDEKNYALLSPNLFRVQKIASKYYNFRHHLDTTVKENDKLRNITWKRIQKVEGVIGIVKVRVDNNGRIVQVGEYK